MYNTDFIVKYHDIEKELILKLKTKTPEEYQLNSDEEYEYNNQDILDICNKLYRDELCSVFYAENIIDDKIDKGMKDVFEKILINSHVKAIIYEMKELLYLNESSNSQKEQTNTLKDNADLIVLLSLFSPNIFYITHKCICQQLTLGSIDNNLLVELKKHTINVLTK